LAEKRAEYEAATKPVSAATAAAVSSEASPFPETAQLCHKCMTKASILMDGCMTCLNCGDSKCG